MEDNDKHRSFWTTLPGIITATTGLVTALATLVGALYTSGLIGPRDGATPTTSASTQPPAATAALPPPTQAPGAPPAQPTVALAALATSTPQPALPPVPLPTITPASLLLPTPTEVIIQAVGMTTYESVFNPFSIQYPSNWTQQPPVFENITANFVGPVGEVLAIAEEDLFFLGLGPAKLEEYVEATIFGLQLTFPDFRLLGRRQATIGPQSLQVEIVDYIAGSFRATRLIYLEDGFLAFNATYLGTPQQHQQLQGTIAASFDTFRVTE